jgi:hypothetical protein
MLDAVVLAPVFRLEKRLCRGGIRFDDPFAVGASRGGHQMIVAANVGEKPSRCTFVRYVQLTWASNPQLV